MPNYLQIQPPLMEALSPRHLLAVISGIVWNDADSSQTLDESEKTLAGVTVFIDANRNRRLDAGERRALTDSTGTYSFTGLAAGSYDLMQVPPAGFGVQTPGRLGTLEHQFDIGLNYLSEVTPSQARAFEIAAQRWEAILVGDLPDVQIDIGLVDDIVMDVSILSIDGESGTLAQAEPTQRRAGTELPSRGLIELDWDDISTLEAGGKLVDTITHEMAHVLGFGTIWTAKNLVAGIGTSNPRFTGAQARAAYNAIVHTNSTGVPLEANGGPGTNLTHWREEKMVVEQMSGYTESPGVVEPISRVTVAQFADLGYTVNYDAADTWNPTGVSSYWTPADAKINPFTRRVVVASNTAQNDVDFGLRANAAPVVKSFGITPASPVRGATLTLSAAAIDPDGDPLAGVTFYRESNGVAGLQAGSDTYVSTKLTAKRGVFSAAVASDGLSGNVTFYASAVDGMLFAGKRAASTFIRPTMSPPARPNPLVATRQHSTTIRLQWKDRSNNESGFRIEIATDANFIPARVIRHFNVPAGSVQAVITGLRSDTGYFFRIRAYNDAGVSAYTRVGPIA